MVFTLGLISDIHGDLDSLIIALNMLHGQQVDTILCAGDLVEKGEQGDAVVQRIKEQSVPCVLGNHDEAAESNQRWLRENADFNHPHTRGRLLTDDTLTYIRDLPFSRRFTWENRRVLLVHGTPKSNGDFLFPQSSPDKYKAIAQTAEADVIVFGHTHAPTMAFFDGVWFFNPGSVCAEEGRRACATLRLPDCTFSVFDLTTGHKINVPYVH